MIKVSGYGAMDGNWHAESGQSDIWCPNGTKGYNKPDFNRIRIMVGPSKDRDTADAARKNYL